MAPLHKLHRIAQALTRPRLTTPFRPFHITTAPKSYNTPSSSANTTTARNWMITGSKIMTFLSGCACGFNINRISVEERDRTIKRVIDIAETQNELIDLQTAAIESLRRRSGLEVGWEDEDQVQGQEEDSTYLHVPDRVSYFDELSAHMLTAFLDFWF